MSATIETALANHLAADSAVAALVSDRIFRAGNVPSSVNRRSQAYIVYQRISSPRERHQGGPAGLAHPRFQFSCYAPASKTAKQVCDAVREAVHTASGAIGAAGNTVTVKVCVPEDERESPALPSDASAKHTPCYVLDVVVWHAE